MKVELFSDRLRIRNIKKDDMAFLINLEKNPLVQKFRNFSLSDDDIIEMYLEEIESNDEELKDNYVLMVERLLDNTVLGKINISINSKYIDEWEIGWIFHPEFWGNGYAVEASKKVIEFFINNLHVHRIISICDSKNIKSENVMIRIGMKKESCIQKAKFFKGSWHDEVIYSIEN
ncbi:MAG: GNAT family N-acetyltransferase [Oscillospiraceae bacterium]|nr:GNAT family N-acetyltransferase [Oscillospiraceae bacterium]